MFVCVFLHQCKKSKKERCNLEYLVLNEFTNITGTSETWYKENNELKTLKSSNLV